MNSTASNNSWRRHFNIGIAYLNLIFGGFGILCLFICTYSSKVKNDTVSTTFSSPAAKNAGVALLVSSLPLLLKVAVNIFVYKKTKGILFGRAFYSFATFLFGLHLTLQYDIFQIFISYDASIWFMFGCYRIAFVSTIMFFISITDLQNETGYSTIAINIFASAAVCLQTFPSDGKLSILKTITPIIYVLFVVFFLIQRNIRNWKNSSNYSHWLYVNVILIPYFFVSLVRFHFFFFSSNVDIYTATPLTSIYMYVLVAAVLTVIPGMISNHELVQSKDQIIATKITYHRYMSHELRNPMTVVDMGISYCLSKIPENITSDGLKDIRKTLSEIKGASDDGLTILNDFLVSDKIENGILSLQKESVNIFNFVSEYLSMFKVQIRSKNIKLEFRNGSDLTEFGQVSSKKLKKVSSPQKFDRVKKSDTFYADKAKIGQVLRNLMSNAIKFTPIKGTICMNIAFVQEENKNSLDDTTIKENAVEQPKFSFSSVFINFYWLIIKYFFSNISAPISPLKMKKPNEQIDTEQKNSKVKGMLVIEIRDSGAGISPENQARLFKEIIQFNAAKLQAGGGSGLGLWISKSMVDMHGGRLSVHSEGEGKGSTFRLEIPMTRDIETDHLLENNTVSTNTTTSTGYSSKISVINSDDIVEYSSDDITDPTLTDVTKTTFTSSLELPLDTNLSTISLDATITTTIITKNDLEAFPNTNMPINLVTPSIDIRLKRFLIVDDVDMIRKMLRKLLEQRGHICDEAEDGLVALNMVKNTINPGKISYDVIFMDFVMPNMSGPDATRALRNLGYTGQIIGATGNSHTEDKDMFMNAGLTNVLIKPLRIEKLLEIMEV